MSISSSKPLILYAVCVASPLFAIMLAHLPFIVQAPSPSGKSLRIYYFDISLFPLLLLKGERCPFFSKNSRLLIQMRASTTTSTNFHSVRGIRSRLGTPRLKSPEIYATRDLNKSAHQINPNGRSPALIHQKPNGESFKVFESAAIQLYVAQHFDKDFKFSCPLGSEEQSEVIQWVLWGVSLSFLRPVHPAVYSRSLSACGCWTLSGTMYVSNLRRP
jgi:hypothetical protein